MRYFLVFTLVTAVAVAANRVESAKAQQAADAAKTVRATSIVLVDEDGNERVTLRASRDTSGVWVTGPTGETAALYANARHGAVVGLWASPGKDSASDYAVSARAGGGVAVRHPGK